MTAYWIGVASREHVLAGRAGGFCQLCHGRAAPLRRLEPGDRIVYYAPRERMRDGATVQAFTAVGEVLDGAPQQVDTGNGFRPYRSHVRYFEAREAPIRPLLPRLSFTRGRASWGFAFRQGAFPIDAADYLMIAEAMEARDTDLVAGFNDGLRVSHA